MLSLIDFSLKYFLTNSSNLRAGLGRLSRHSIPHRLSHSRQHCVTKASAAKVLKAHELFKKIKEGHPEIIERCEYGIADRGYDDGKLIGKLWDNYDIKPVIDIRNMWKDEEETKALVTM